MGKLLARKTLVSLIANIFLAKVMTIGSL